MATKKLTSEFLSKIIVDTSQPDKALPGISDLIKQLNAQLKAATAEAARLGAALGKGDGSAEEYARVKQEIKGVKTALSELNTIKKALKIVQPGDVENLKDLNRQINLTVSTLNGVGRRADVKAGVFGLNPASVKEGITNLKALERAAKEARVELAMVGDTKGLKSLDKTVKQNEARLTNQVNVLRQKDMQADQDLFQNLQLGKQQKALEKAHTQALAMEAGFEKGRQALRQRQHAEQALFQNLQLGRQQSELKRAHTQALAENAAFDAKVLEREKKKAEAIAKWRREAHEAQALAERNAQRPVDPAAEQKQVKQAAERRMGLIGGVGGASLIAVQASLMANYSILQNVVNTLTAGIRTSVELESAFRNIQAVTVTTATEMKGLETQIKDVAAASKFTSVEVAQAALILGQAGLNAKQTGEAIKAIATLAAASGTSMAESVDLVTSVIGVFDKKASEAVDVTNKITAAANSSKINVEKMTLAFQYAGNTSAQMGVSFEETTAALAAMSNAGIKSGSTMGTGLRAFMTETQKPTEEFIKIITNLGLSLTDLDFKSHGLLGVARKLREAGFIASDAIKSFDVRSAAAFNAMVANPEDLERQYKLLLDTNAGLEAEAIQMDSLKSQSARLTTSLGNLAASGFAPLGKLLTGVASGFATVAQAMSEWEVAMGIAGATIGVALTAAVMKYTLSLALGAAATLGLTTATTASIGAMTLGAFTTAVLTKAKIAYAAATATATASTFSLAGAVRLLSGVGIFGALGLAVAAATAVFVGFDYAMGSSKRKSDELRAALDNSKGTYEEQVGVIDSLNRKIEELNHKSDTLAGNQKDVEMMGVALTAQFGKEGFASDKLTTSFAQQAEQLKKLKDLKEQSAKQALELAQLDADAVVKNQEQTLAKDFQNVRQRGTVAQGIDRALGSEDIKLLNVAQVDILKDMKKALEGNDPKNPGPLASATEILRILALKVKDDSMFGGRSRFYGEAADQLGVVSSTAVNVRQSQEERTDLAIKASQAAAAKTFGEAKLFGGKTFVEAIRETKSVGIEQRIIASREAQGPNGKTDPLKLHQLAMEQTRKSMAELAEMEKILEEHRINTTDEAKLANLRTARTEVNARQEAARVAMDRLTEQTQPAADRAELIRKGSAKGSERQKNRDVSAEEIRANALAEAQYKHRGVIIPERQEALIAADVAGGDQWAINVRDQGPAAAIRQFRLAEEVALREAKLAQRSANLAGTEESAKAYLDAGLKSRAQARDAALAQLKAKLAEDSAVGGNRAGLTKGERDLELKNFNDSEDQKDRDFILGFTGFANVAKLEMQKVRAATNETRQDLLDLQNANTQAQYDRGEGARELQAQFDVNTKMGDPRGDNLLLERKLKRELVGVDQQYLVSKEAELRLEDQIIAGAETELALMEASLKATESKVEELQKLHDMGKGFLTQAQEAEFVAAKSQLLPEQTEVRNQRALVAASRRQRVDTQKDLYATRGRIRENLMPEIQEVNLENLSRAMDDVWAKWQNISANMDIIRTMREGFGAQVTGFTNSLGQSLSAIASGTKSVKEGFKDMAISVIQNLLDVTTQMLAMYAVQKLIGMVSALAGGMTGGAAPGSGSGSLGFSGIGGASPFPMGAEGGYMTPSGFFERVQFLAGGGPIRGGVTGRDSVPTMLMPGEFVIQKSAADVVGTDYLHGLNAQTQGIARGGSVQAAPAPKENKVLNIWVVTPDQMKQQGTTANDIVVVVEDNISRKGSLHRLIKQVNLGNG